MKYAILGDIHSNLEALEAVIYDAKQQGVSKFACTGDIVGYNADPKKCLKMVRDLGAVIVQGNHDYYAGCNQSMDRFTPIAQKSIYWTRKNLSIFDRKYLRNLPYIAETEDFTIVHSSLDTPEDWTYILQKHTAQAHFKNQFNTLCFFGHTHVPSVFIKGDKPVPPITDSILIEPDSQYLINVGSVGQPRDKNKKASYAIYDTETKMVAIQRVEYDIELTQQKIRKAGLPFRNALRLAHGQ